jgi:sarcosine oxidase
VTLTLDRGELRARAVVVTAGAWAAGLLASVGIELAVVPTRETVVYVDVPGAERLPPVIDSGMLPVKGEGGIARVGQSAFSLAAPGKGLKAGLHHSGPAADPEAEREPDPSVAAWTARWVAARFAEAGETLGAETCLYTNTSDEEFVLERHGRVVVGSACSGHGFKFAPIVGRTLAALAREAAE